MYGRELIYKKIDESNHYSIHCVLPRFFDANTGVFQYLVFDFMNVFCPPCDVFTAPPAASYLYFTEDGGATWVPFPPAYP
jgi:hypothetical protein